MLTRAKDGAEAKLKLAPEPEPAKCNFRSLLITYEHLHWQWCRKIFLKNIQNFESASKIKKVFLKVFFSKAGNT